MPATTGYAAAPETDDVAVSYGAESAWGTAPSSQFQAIRLMGESMSPTKDRSRPGEMNPRSEVVQAVTSRVKAGGQINLALSYGTFDELISGVLGADWQAAQAIVGVSGDITLTNISSTSATLSSTTSNKFANLAAGQWVRNLGYTNVGNNNPARVAAKASNQSLTLTTLVPVVTETPTGANAKVRASTIVNGSLFKSYSLQKQVGPSLFFRYPGTFFNGFSLQGSVGGFVQGSLTAMSQTETTSTSDWSTGAVLAAPTGSVNDVIGGFGGMYFDEAAIDAGIDTINLNITRQDADVIHAMGSAAAAGMKRGRLEARGSVKMLFRNFTQYNRFMNETPGRISFITKDSAGNAYVATWLAGVFMNPQIVADSPGSVVYATFDIEGNPQAAGGTFQLDRLPSV